jgi:hypothetical protein
VRAGRTIAVVLLALVLLVVVVGSPREDDDEPFDPASSEPGGALALVLLLRELGATVEVVDGPPPAGATAAVVLRDRLTDDDRAATRRWVAGGRTLLVAGFSALASHTHDAACPAAVDAADELSPDDGIRVRRFDEGFDRCFGGFVRTEVVGDGTIVEVTLAEPFTNQLLDDADNDVFAAALLAPVPADARVAVLDGPTVPPVTGDGEDTLYDLVGGSARQAMVEAGIAVVVWVLWRARRLGRPVHEDQPVVVAGSELVVAVGRLLDARRQPHEAAAALRADVRRAVDARLGLPPGAEVRTAAAAVAARTGMDEGRAAAALGERPVHGDDDLLDVAADLDRIRSDLLGSPHDRSSL